MRVILGGGSLGRVLDSLRAQIVGGRSPRPGRGATNSEQSAYHRRLRETWPPDAIAARDAYESGLEVLVGDGLGAAPPLPLRVVSFACERDLPEQVASIRSLLTHAGAPAELTIVSDGSHSAWSRDLLQAIHPCVAVVDWRLISKPGLPQMLWDYAEANWRGRKLLVIASLAVDCGTLIADADILFFTRARELRQLVNRDETDPRYLRDLDGGPSLDPELLESERERAESVNSGFVFLPRPLNWSSVLRRLEQRLRSGRTTFTAQTVVHLALHESHARPFERSRYVMAVDDREVAEDPYVGPQTVMRHYVTPVRHKFWTTLACSAHAQPPRHLEKGRNAR